MTLTINPTFNAIVKTVKLDGTTKKVNLPYMVNATVGGSNYLTVSLSTFPDKDAKVIEYCSFSVKKDLSLVFNFSYVANKKGYLTNDFKNFANTSEVIFKHFETLTIDFDSNKSKLQHNQSYQLLLPLLSDFTDNLVGSLDSGFTRKMGNIEQDKLILEWSKFKNSNDSILSTVGNAMDLTLQNSVNASQPVKTEAIETSVKPVEKMNVSELTKHLESLGLEPLTTKKEMLEQLKSLV